MRNDEVNQMEDVGLRQPTLTPHAVGQSELVTD